MFRTTLFTLSVLLSVVAVAPAQAAISLPFDASDLLAVGCSAPIASVPEADVGALSVTCEVSCGSSPAVSCTVSGSCTAVDRDCAAGQRGYVECNGSRIYCPVCPVCEEGAIRYVDTWDCCKQTLKKQSYQRCIGGQWVHQYYTCAPVPFCPEA